MITIVALIALAVIACYLCRIWAKSQERHMSTEEFRNYYNKVRKEEAEIKAFLDETRKRKNKQ